jgi:hypothetical protein
MSRPLLLVAALLTLGASLSGQSAADARWLAECRDRDQGWRVKHCEVRVSALARTEGTIAVDPGTNGGVGVRGWDADSIEVHARIETEGRSDGDAAALAGRIRVVTAGATIGVAGPPQGGGASWSVSFAVFAPRHSDLRLDTYNGPIAVKDLSGRITVTAYNGPVALRGVGGDVHARTTNGPLAIELTGERWEGAGLDAETTNGPVELAIPAAYSAQLEVGTVNGPMTLEFPLTVTIMGRVGRRITTVLGKGGAPVRAITTNGPAVIRRN